MNNIKEWIRAAREKAVMTQEQLGDALGRSKANVSSWENGLHEPSFTQILHISAVTGHSVSPLLSGVLNSFDEPPEKPTIRHRLSALTPEQLVSLYEKLSHAKRRELTGLVVVAGLVPGLSVEVTGQWKETSVPGSGKPTQGVRRRASKKPPPADRKSGQ